MDIPSVDTLKHAYIDWKDFVAQVYSLEFDEEQTGTEFELAISRIREDVLLELEDHLQECALDYDDDTRYCEALTEVKKFRLDLEDKL